MTASDAPAKDEGELIGLTDSAICVDKSLLEGIDGSATTKDEIVTELHLRKKQPMLNSSVLSLFGSEKGRKASQPFLGTDDQIIAGERIGEFLQGLRVRTLHKSVRALLKADITLSQAHGQPVMLIETDASGEGEIGTDPHKHLPPVGVLDVEVVLLDPSPLQLQMPTVVFPNGGHDGGGLARFDDGHDLVGLRASEVARHEVIAPTGRIFLNRYTPFLGAVFGPVVVLRSDVPQQLPTNGIDLAIGPEKADGPLFLLKGLDRGMQQDPIEATIVESDVILMVFVEGVHGSSRGVRSLEHTPVNASAFYACWLHSRGRPDFYITGDIKGEARISVNLRTWLSTGNCRMIAWHDAIAQRAVSCRGQGRLGSNPTLPAERLGRTGPLFGSLDTRPRCGRRRRVAENFADPLGQWMFFSRNRCSGEASGIG